MSNHIKKAFQADPLRWCVGIVAVLSLIFMLNTCINHEKPTPVEPIDAVPVSE